MITITELKDFYENKYATEGLRGISDLRFEKTLEQFMKYVEINENWTLLDIGCGVGGFMQLAPFKKKIGVDLSENALK